MTDAPESRREPVSVDELPPVQWLILDTLAARARLGERAWPFPNRMLPALRALAALGLIEYEPHNADSPRSQRARFTDLGARTMFPPEKRYRSPLEQEVMRYTQALLDRVAAETRLEGIEQGPDGALVIHTQPPRELVKHLALMLAGFLGDAPNYNETPIVLPRISQGVPVPGTEDQIVVTVQRCPGTTPHEARTAAEERAQREERAADLLIEILRQIKHLAHRDPDEVRRLAVRGPVAAREIREGTY